MFDALPPRGKNTLIKPAGRVVGINPLKAPPGLVYCFPFDSPAFPEIKAGLQVAAKGTTTLYGSSPRGTGASFTQATTSWITYAIPSWTLTSPFSLECIVWVASTSGWTAFQTDIGGMVNSTSAPAVTNFPFAMGCANTLAQIGAEISNGTVALNGAPMTAPGYYHLVFTWDGTNCTLYYNGVSTGSAASAAPAGALSALVWGGSGGDNTVPGVFLFGSVANAAWSAAEILARFYDPYGYLKFAQVPWSIGTAQPTGGGITGTLASTDPTDVSSMGGGEPPAATKTIYFLNTTATTPDWNGSLQDGGIAPSAANSTWGWGPAKTAITTPYYQGRVGATATVTTASSTTTISAAPTVGTGATNTTAGNSFGSAAAYNGVFAAGNWSFTFAVRASTAGCAGRVNFRVWASTSQTGSSARELTSGAINGATVTLSTTTTTYNSTATFAAPQIILANEYLFIEVEWQETTVGTANNANVLFYQSAALFTTTAYAASISGTLGPTEATDTSAIAGTVLTPVSGTLSTTDPTDTAALPSVVSSFPPVIYVPAQSGVGTNGSATVTSYTYTLPAAISPGNSVFLSIGGASSGGDFTGMTVTDNASGNSYHISQTGFYGPAGYAVASFYGLRLQGSPTTITVNYPYAITFASVKVDTFSSLGSIATTGTAAPWNFQTTPGTAAGAITTNNFTPPAIGDLIWTITVDVGSDGGISGSAGYNLCQYLSNTWYSQWALASSTASQAATWSSTAGATGYYASTATVIAPLGFEAALASTDPTDTSAIAGTVAWSGTLAATDITDTAGFAGTVVNDGTLSSTEALDGAGFAGTVANQGTFSVTDITDTMTSGAGSVAWITQFNLTDPTDTSNMSGSVLSADISGTFSVTDTTDTAAIAGTVTGVAGTLASTDIIDTSAASGTVAWLGTLVSTDPTDTASLTGQSGTSGTLSSTDPTDTSVIGVTVTWLGTLATTDTPDVSTITGLTAALGTLSSTDIIDTSAIAAVVFAPVTGTLSSTEAIDTANIPGTVLTGDAGGFNTIDPTDTAAIAGSVTGVAGALASTEAIDTAAGAGGVAWVAILASTDPTDQTAIVGQTAWAATLSTTEALDTASLAGVAAWSLSLAATDAPDMAALVGAVFVPVTGVLAATELPDQGTFSGLVLTGIGGGLVTTDPPDSAALSGNTGWTFSLAAIDPTDIALFAGEIFAIADAVVVASDQALYVCIGSDLPLNGVPDDEVVCTAGDYALYRCLASDQAVGGGMPEPQDRALDLVLA